MKKLLIVLTLFTCGCAPINQINENSMQIQKDIRTIDNVSIAEEDALKYYNDGYTIVGNSIFYLGEHKFDVDFSSVSDTYGLANLDLSQYVLVDDYIYVLSTKYGCDHFFARISTKDGCIENLIDYSELLEYGYGFTMFKQGNTLKILAYAKGWSNLLTIDTDDPTRIIYDGKIKESKSFSIINPINENMYAIKKSKYDIAIINVNTFDIIKEFSIEGNINYKDKILGDFYRDDEYVIFTEERKEIANNIRGGTDKQYELVMYRFKDGKLINRNVLFKKSNSAFAGEVSEAILTEDKFIFKDSKIKVYSFINGKLYQSTSKNYSNVKIYFDMWSEYIYHYGTNGEITTNSLEEVMEEITSDS